MYNSSSFGVQPLMHPSFTSNGMAMMMGKSTNFVSELMRSTHHHQPFSTTPYSGFLGSDNTQFPKVLQGQEICSLRSLTGKPNIGSWAPPRTDLGNVQCNVLNMYRTRENNPSFYPLGSEGGRNFAFPNTISEPNSSMPANFMRFPIISPPVAKTVNTIIEPNSSSEKDDGASDSIGSSCKLFGFPLNETPPIQDAKSLSKRSCTKVRS